MFSGVPSYIADPRTQQRKERVARRYPAAPVPTPEPAPKYDFSTRFRKPQATRGGGDFGRSSTPRNYFKDVPRPPRVDAKPMKSADFHRMKLDAFKKHQAVVRSGVDGSTPLSCRRGLRAQTMGAKWADGVRAPHRSKCKTGTQMRREAALNTSTRPKTSFEYLGVKVTYRRPAVEADPAAGVVEESIDEMLERHAKQKEVSFVPEAAAAPAPAPLTPGEEALVGPAFAQPTKSRFKDVDLLAGVDVYAHMRDHAARGRPVSTMTGMLSGRKYRGGERTDFVPLEVGKPPAR